ncbi:MAG: type II secretion system F family protein [Actinomycetota bacterium]
MTAIAVTIGLAGWYQRPRPWAYVLIATAGVLLNPFLGIGAAASIVFVRRWRVIAAKREAAGQHRHDVLVALDLVSLATTAGLPFHHAVSLASREIGGALAGDLDRAVSRVDAGLDHALGSGPLARAFDAARRSALSGARLGGTLVDLAKEVRADEAAAERERIERLPVKLLFPLAFLILPGFVLVAVVPSIVSGISSLSF